MNIYCGVSIKWRRNQLLKCSILKERHPAFAWLDPIMPPAARNIWFMWSLLFVDRINLSAITFFRASFILFSFCIVVCFLNCIGTSQFENRVLKTIFGPKRDEVAGGWKICIMRSSISCTLHQILLGWANQGGWGGWGLWRAWGDEKYIEKFCRKAWR
jgi:hypothetical protein